jgi:hypothetical protein
VPTVSANPTKAKADVYGREHTFGVTPLDDEMLGERRPERRPRNPDEN